jgi:type II secretory pathway predicted ATPase ExeA
MHAQPNDHYYRKYNLERDPFPVNEIEKKLYITGTLHRWLNELKALVADNEKIILVTGGAGSGKTSLSRQLEALKSPIWKTSLLRTGSSTSIDVLAYGIVRMGATEKENAVSPVSQVHKYLEYCANNQLVPVLIIDDAHKLPHQTLEFLLQLAELRYGKTLFRIVMFADNSMHERLKKPELESLASGVMQNMRIPPFSREETGKYIDHHLSCCGKVSHYPFTGQDFAAIHQNTGGVPGAINLAARRIMQERIKSPALFLYFRYVAGLAVVTLIMASAYILYFREDSQSEVKAPDRDGIPPAGETLAADALETVDTAPAPVIPDTEAVSEDVRV